MKRTIKLQSVATTTAATVAATAAVTQAASSLGESPVTIIVLCSRRNGVRR